MHIRNLCLAFSLLGAGGLAHGACTQADLRIVGHLKPTVGIYASSGKFLQEQPKERFPVGTTLIDCNDSLGIALVKPATNSAPAEAAAKSKAPADKVPQAEATAAAADEPPVWIDLNDVKISQQFQPPCVQAASAPNSQKRHASAGVQNDDCKPASSASK